MPVIVAQHSGLWQLYPYTTIGMASESHVQPFGNTPCFTNGVKTAVPLLCLLHTQRGSYGAV
jgi:hypothetical protein